MCHDSFPLFSFLYDSEWTTRKRTVGTWLPSRVATIPSSRAQRKNCHPERSRGTRFSLFSCALPALQLNIANLNRREILPVPPRNLILIALLELQHRQFLSPPLAHNLASNGHFRRIRPQHHFLLVGMHRQHRAERHFLAHVSANPLNPYSVAGRDAILLPPGLYDGVHRSSTCKDKPQL